MGMWFPSLRRAVGIVTMGNAPRLNTTASLLLFCFLRQDGLGSGKTGHRHAVRRAGDIVQSNAVEEVNGIRITAVFTAYTQLQIGPCLTATLDSNAHEFAHTFLIETRERILFKYPAIL